jgi:site-specific DNA recombinase
MLKAIEDGLYNQSMKQRMATLESERVTIQARLDQLGAAPPIRLHPNLSAVYTEKAARLADALNAPESKAEAGEIIRSLVERIMLTPRRTAESGAAKRPCRHAPSVRGGKAGTRPL